MDLDIFLQEQNIKRYRKLLESSTGPTERQTIFKLLANEMETLKKAANKSTASIIKKTSSRLASF